jgi:hypothetical protein
MHEQGCKNLWLFFTAKRGLQAKSLGNTALEDNNKLNSILVLQVPRLLHFLFIEGVRAQVIQHTVVEIPALVMQSFVM